MQRNKYLEDIGLRQDKYGTNFISNKLDKRHRRWKKQRKEYGFDDRETWCLDNMFAQWLYSHLMMYKEKASEVVDLEYRVFHWKGKNITQLDAIDIIINASKDYLLVESKYIDNTISYQEREKIYDNFSDVMTLWGVILPCMWW